MTRSILETAIKNRHMDLELKYYEVSSSSDNKPTAPEGFNSLAPHNRSQAEFVCLLSMLLNHGGQRA